MAPGELEESIELLKRDLLNYIAKNGLADEEAIQKRRRVDVYMKRYKELKEGKELHQQIS